MLLKIDLRIGENPSICPPLKQGQYLYTFSESRLWLSLNRMDFVQRMKRALQRGRSVTLPSGEPVTLVDYNKLGACLFPTTNVLFKDDLLATAYDLV